MKIHHFILTIVTVVSLLTGCMEKHKALPWQKVDDLPVVRAHLSKSPVIMDGLLDDPVWKKSTAYMLYIPKDREGQGQILKQPGEVRFAWDKRYFYVACTFTDSDIQARGTDDHEHHYRMGDLCEVFLRPSHEAYYWEMYVTPKGHKTCFFFPMRGSNIQVDKDVDLQVAAQVAGTLNDSSDSDSFWTGEMRISRKDLAKYGYKFGPKGNPWQVLIGRYNYFGDPARQENELSTHPKLSITRYHLLEEHARIEFVK